MGTMTRWCGRSAAAGLLATVSVLGASVSASAQPGSPAQPKTQCEPPAAGRTFAAADPAKLGLDPAALRDAVGFGTKALSTSVRVYRHGCLAAKSGPDLLTERVPYPLASSSKGVLSLVIGRAITLGKLSLDDRIGRYLPEADAAHGALTVRQLLNQTSGLKFSWGDEVAGLATDPVRQMLKLPFAHEPGTVFEYAQTTLSVLGVIVERATGKGFQAFAQEQLMGKVGIPRDHWVWIRDRSGYTVTAGGLLLRPDDQARLGELMLREGRWGGTQLVSQDYLRQAVTGTAANPGYGFLYWLNAGDRYKIGSLPKGLVFEHPIFPGTPRDAYSFVGALGQLIVIVPSRDMVIVRNGLPNNIDLANPVKYFSATTNPDFKELVRRIVASVSDVPRNTDPGPYTYQDDTGSLIKDPADLDVWLNPQLVISTLLGRGASGDCNLLRCNGRSLLQDLASLSADTIAQVRAALAATLRG